jgi:hypothetical protein
MLQGTINLSSSLTFSGDREQRNVHRLFQLPHGLSELLLPLSATELQQIHVRRLSNEVATESGSRG